MMAERPFAEGSSSESLHVGRSAVRNLQAVAAELNQTAVQRLTAENVTASHSAFGVVNATTVEVGATSTNTSFRAETRALLFFGGAFFDESFHTAVIC